MHLFWASQAAGCGHIWYENLDSHFEKLKVGLKTQLGIAPGHALSLSWAGVVFTALVN